MEQSFMKEKPVLRLVFSMALPMVISMLVNSLYNIVDSFFVAQISEDAMTALSLVYPVQNLINAVAIGFGIGINAVIAYHLGAQEQEKADQAASWGVVWNLVHGGGADRRVHRCDARIPGRVYGQRGCRRPGRPLFHGGFQLFHGDHYRTVL